VRPSTVFHLWFELQDLGILPAPRAGTNASVSAPPRAALLKDLAALIENRPEKPGPSSDSLSLSQGRSSVQNTGTSPARTTFGSALRSRIAQRPVEPRHRPRLLAVRGPTARPSPWQVWDLQAELEPGDLLAWLTTPRVLKARLKAPPGASARASGASFAHPPRRWAAGGPWPDRPKRLSRARRDPLQLEAENQTAVGRGGSSGGGPKRAAG